MCYFLRSCVFCAHFCDDSRRFKRWILWFSPRTRSIPPAGERKCYERRCEFVVCCFVIATGSKLIWFLPYLLARRGRLLQTKSVRTSFQCIHNFVRWINKANFVCIRLQNPGTLVAGVMMTCAHGITAGLIRDLRHPAPDCSQLAEMLSMKYRQIIRNMSSELVQYCLPSEKWVIYNCHTSCCAHILFTAHTLTHEFPFSFHLACFLPSTIHIDGETLDFHSVHKIELMTHNVE